jgi:hypothetical protein
VKAALRFVQDDIRYLSLTMGPGSMVPRDPDLVFSRRLGDCKDKALLLCAILRDCGVEGRVALVNTAFRERVRDWLPSPLAFDHTIVQVRLGAKTYWLDPTRSQQRGDLATLSALPFGSALVLEPGIRDLTRIPPRLGTSRSEIRELFTVDHYDSAVTLQVETTVRGTQADELRTTLLQPESELEKWYLNFYEGLYPGIIRIAPVSFEDDTVANRIDIHEGYSIPNFWTDIGGRMQCEVLAHGILPFLARPNRRIRSMPVGVFHPFRQLHVIELRMPVGSDWNLEDERRIIDDEAFRYEFSDEFEGNHVRCTYSLESKKHSVAAGRVAEYLARLDEVEETLTYGLSRPAGDQEPVDSGPNWAVLFAGIMWTMLSAAAAIAFYHFSLRRWPAAVPDDADPSLAGFGGWLLLVALGVCVGPLVQLRLVVTDNEALSVGTWSMLTTPGTDFYHPMWAPVLLFELFGNISLFMLRALLVFLFFRRRRAFPGAFVFTVLASIGYVVADALLCLQLPDITEMDPEATRDLVRSVVGAIIWIPYVLVSKRVKATFTE